jgi:hypothetical protein
MPNKILFGSTDNMKTYLSRNYFLALALLVISLSMLACMETVPPTPTADSAATAQALIATEQALSLLATEQALKATQDAFTADSAAAAVQIQPTDAKEWVTFAVINNSNISVCRVYISPASKGEWSISDSHSVQISPNTTQTFTVLPGVYDLRVDDCSDNKLAEHYSVEIPTYTSWTLTRDSSTADDREPLCGNGVCGDFENPGNCPQDCQTYSALCGNGYCESGEDAINCGYDCGFCPDGYCTGFENQQNCPQDCN